MKDFHYVITNFFTHQDYLVSPDLIPGTLWTPLHFIFEGILIAIIIFSAIYLAKRKNYIKPVFKVIWLILVIWEVVITIWDNYSGNTKCFNFEDSLPLYPCSLIMYTLPLYIWGKRDVVKKIAFGYIFSLGLLGAIVNFLFPWTRLETYSCISFPSFHTFFFHGSILFVFLVLLLSGEHSYRHVYKLSDLFIPSVASLIMSIPANIVNYSPINSDYMYFKGHFFALQKIFYGMSEIKITVIIYLLYVIIPLLFYLPSYLHNNEFVKKIFVKQKNLFSVLFQSLGRFLNI